MEKVEGPGFFRRHWPFLAGAAVALFGGALVFLLQPEEPAATIPAPTASSASPSVLHYDQDGYRFTYHVLSSDEGLFDLQKDPKLLRNLARAQPDQTRKLRKALEQRLGVEKLEDLRERFNENIERLKGLGYL